MVGLAATPVLPEHLLTELDGRRAYGKLSKTHGEQDWAIWPQPTNRALKKGNLLLISPCFICLKEDSSSLSRLI